MKATYLVTLSAYIDNQSVQDLSTLRFKCNVQDYNERLKQSVTLLQFILCKNGVPLGRISDRQCKQSQCVVYDACGNCSCSVDYQQELYEAQKSVIFEGWEVVRNDFFKEQKTTLVRIKDQIGTELEFYYNEFNKLENIDGVYNGEPFSYEYIQTLADLAAATQLNPLKLK